MITLVSVLLSGTGFAMIIAAMVANMLGRIKKYVMYGYWTVAQTLSMISSVITKDHIMANLSAALLAYFAWAWWTGGGGDGTKRRLRKIAERFTPSRRTAPQSA